MRPNKFDSITARVVRAVVDGGNPAEVEAQELQALTKPIEDWINDQAAIDKFYCAYVLGAAYEAVMGFLDDEERKQLDDLKHRFSSMGLAIPVKERET